MLRAMLWMLLRAMLRMVRARMRMFRAVLWMLRAILWMLIRARMRMLRAMLWMLRATLASAYSVDVNNKGYAADVKGYAVVFCAQVYAEVDQLVQSALDGYKVCLFSYGQTGSGKTHTMLGAINGDERGIIPRSVEKIIQQSEKYVAKGWRFEMEASYVEIYQVRLSH